MTPGPTYRAAARYFFESPPRLDMAHKEPVNQAHRAPKSESLALAVVVLVAGLAGIAALQWFALWPVPG